MGGLASKLAQNPCLFAKQSILNSVGYCKNGLEVCVATQSILLAKKSDISIIFMFQCSPNWYIHQSYVTVKPIFSL